MKRLSLYIIILGIFLILIIGSFTSVHFLINHHKQDLLETAIEEKTHLAEIINETLASPAWTYRLALVPGMEKAFVSEMAEFKDVKYIRVVKENGTIYKSSIEEEWGEILKEPDISKALSTGQTIVKDQTFKGEQVKLIIYPGYHDKTVWVAFSLESTQNTIREMWIRDILIMAGGLMIMILIVFLIFRDTIINPLKKMTAACEEMRKGNLEVTVPVKGKTEIGELATTFNQMTKNLRESQANLEEAKATLQIRVKAKTKELRRLNQELEDRVQKRTRELQKRVNELERFHRLTVGRETRMIELKDKIKELKEKVKKLKQEDEG